MIRVVWGGGREVCWSSVDAEGGCGEAGGRHISQLPGLELPPDFVPEPLQCDRQGPFPYVVSLRDGSNRHFCGGVVISQNTVATAASCLGRPASDIILAIGGFDVSNPVEVSQWMLIGRG